ncbi:hypothetical protein GJV04_17220 [Enterobacteriaceae bacterium RIT714]|nr:hypothetical protein [Enterobacteriaceae bacterium RIT714]
MNQYLSPFCEIFGDIIKRYGFNVTACDNDTIIMAGRGYQLVFVIWREAVEISYCVIKNDTEVVTYNVRDFIITYMTDADRTISEITFTADQNEVYKRNIYSLNHFANALKNHFPAMLEGRMDWLELFEKSEWYRKPRVENRKA